MLSCRTNFVYLQQMRFEKIIPCKPLKPYVKHLVISENPDAQSYKVFPSIGLVIGFQYSGRLAILNNNSGTPLATAGITGISDGYKVFKNSAGTGSILVFFTETGIARFSDCPANELFNQSISLDNLFSSQKIADTEEQLAAATSDKTRIAVIENFLLSELKEKQDDKLVMEAVKLIHESKGKSGMRELSEKLFISQSPFEKRFRKVVGTSPKKFASIVRFNSVLGDLRSNKPLLEVCYANDFFDQAHFTRDFKRYTGETPEQFKRQL